MSDTGLFREPGWGNIPAGEVFVALLEDSADGVLVLTLSCRPTWMGLSANQVSFLFQQV